MRHLLNVGNPLSACFFINETFTGHLYFVGTDNNLSRYLQMDKASGKL